MASFPKLLLSLSFGTFLIAGCAHDETVFIPNDGGAATTTTGTTEPLDLGSFCSDICNRQAACDSKFDAKTCSNACRNGYAASFSKYREDYVGKVMACVDATSCKTLEIASCESDSAAELAPSDTAIAFCDAVVASKCNLGQTKAQCLALAKTYNDAAITSAQECTTHACSQVTTCVGVAFGGTSTATPTQTTCTTSQYSDLPSGCSSCAAGSCCAEASACAADSQCRALMGVCSTSSPQNSSCYSAVNAISTSSRQLLGAYFQCAQGSCSSSCGWNE